MLWFRARRSCGIRFSPFLRGGPYEDAKEIVSGACNHRDGSGAWLNRKTGVSSDAFDLRRFLCQQLRRRLLSVHRAVLQLHRVSGWRIHDALCVAATIPHA